MEKKKIPNLTDEEYEEYLKSLLEKSESPLRFFLFRRKAKREE